MPGSDYRPFDGLESTSADTRSAPSARTEGGHARVRTETVAFESQGERCEADLSLPTGGDRPWPVVVMGHVFGAERTWGLAPVAERFARAGIAGLAFDYRHLGGSEGKPRRLIDPERQLQDWRAALEYVESLAADARDQLDDLGYGDVSIRTGDGAEGWPEHAPYDAAYLTCAAPEIPEAIVEQLRVGGWLVAPIGTGRQTLVRAEKTEGGLDRERHGAVRFVRMQGD